MKNILVARDGTYEMEKLAKSAEWGKIAELLSSKIYTTLDQSYSVLVRSDLISSEDKVSLGTIKRYGVVADAIIMQGGLAAELRSGGLQVGGEQSKNDIEIEDDDEDEKSQKTVNPAEVKKYIKLFQGSLQDICRIGEPILSK